VEDRGPNNGNTGDGNEARDKKLYHYVYVVGFSILAGVIVDYLFLWPENHLAALLVAAAGLSLITVYEFRNSRKGLNVTLPVLLIVGAFIANFLIPPPPDIEVSGSLQAGNEPTPPNGCDKRPPGFEQISPDALKILVGDNAIVLTGMGKTSVIQIGQCRPLSVERSPSGVSFNADLYDANGKLIARLADGRLSILTSDRVHWSHNGDLTNLTVTDGNGTELLYIRYLNPTTIQARGIFGCPGHTRVVVRDSEPIAGSLTHNGCFVDDGSAIGIN
jgi:hypothetical protein